MGTGCRELLGDSQHCGGAQGPGDRGLVLAGLALGGLEFGWLKVIAQDAHLSPTSRALVVAGQLPRATPSIHEAVDPNRRLLCCTPHPGQLPDRVQALGRRTRSLRGYQQRGVGHSAMYGQEN